MHSGQLAASTLLLFGCAAAAPPPAGPQGWLGNCEVVHPARLRAQGFADIVQRVAEERTRRGYQVKETRNPDAASLEVEWDCQTREFDTQAADEEALRLVDHPDVNVRRLAAEHLGRASERRRTYLQQSASLERLLAVVETENDALTSQWLGNVMGRLDPGPHRETLLVRFKHQTVGYQDAFLRSFWYDRRPEPSVSLTMAAEEASVWGLKEGPIRLHLDVLLSKFPEQRCTELEETARALGTRGARATSVLAHRCLPLRDTVLDRIVQMDVKQWSAEDAGYYLEALGALCRDNTAERTTKATQGIERLLSIRSKVDATITMETLGTCFSVQLGSIGERRIWDIVSGNPDPIVRQAAQDWMARRRVYPN